MNYIAEIKAFYDRLELNPLPSPAIALWHALMSIANKTGWQQEFTVAVSVLVLKSGLNAQAIKRARNRLEQDGYITWRSRGGNQAAVYHLNSLVVQNEVTAISTRFRQDWKPRYCAWRWIFTGMSIWGVPIYHRRFLRCRSAIQQHLLRLPRRSSRKAL